MRASLSGGPAKLEHVKSSLVTNLVSERVIVREKFSCQSTVITNLGPDAVCTLGHWVAVEGKFIIVFYKNIQ